jgi:hypothetical protein
MLLFIIKVVQTKAQKPETSDQIKSNQMRQEKKRRERHSCRGMYAMQSNKSGISNISILQREIIVGIE